MVDVYLFLQICYVGNVCIFVISETNHPKGLNGPKIHSNFSKVKLKKVFKYFESKSLIHLILFMQSSFSTREMSDYKQRLLAYSMYEFWSRIKSGRKIIHTVKDNILFLLISLMFSEESKSICSRLQNRFSTISHQSRMFMNISEICLQLIWMF